MRREERTPYQNVKWETSSYDIVALQYYHGSFFASLRFLCGLEL